MRNNLSFFIFLSLLILSSCGGGGIFGDSDTSEAAVDYEEIREKMEEVEKQGKRQRAQRNRKGDTLAIEPKVLKKYLP
ncbi:MAG: hypothetical protein AAFU64_05925, partial [Bacteroidota bacterium]